ncbi:tetrahydromethanopterin S-methyltransferase subunit F [Rhizobium binae]|uniref:Tetrahydromethanopterin S-methyltransferase subunit F n=1 Tax=Rhizobium binae TaxID=1138190 RepID=A0ABV2MLV1_9HYPH|nr:hypothetical protein [Rhizobium binae]
MGGRYVECFDVSTLAGQLYRLEIFLRKGPRMRTLIDFITWMLALPPALWELANVARRYGWTLGACAGSIVFGGIFLWVTALQWVAEGIHDSAFGVVQAFLLLVVPPAATVFIAKMTGLAAGVFAGIAVGFCVFVITAVIGIGLYGE